MGEQQQGIALRRAVVAVLVVLNVSVICFYGLWQAADTITVNRAEEHGFDPQQLLPHDMLFWFAAQASLLSLLAFDALVIVIVWRQVRRRRQDPRPGAVTPPEQTVQTGQSGGPRRRSDLTGRVGDPHHPTR